MTTGCQSNAEPVYTTGEAARQLGIPPWKVLYLLKNGRLPEVRRVGILRYWSQGDVDHARQLLGGEAK